MNIFVLDLDPVKAAQMQCNVHVNKMSTESAQMLCTAHRILDGRHEKRLSKSGRKLAYWSLPDERESEFYKPVHPNHPCTVWTAETAGNYMWHYRHFIALCKEYTYRYGRVHACQEKFQDSLSRLPININHTTKQTPFPLAMKSNPECMVGDPVVSYRAFYQTKKERFKMVWTNRETPQWFGDNYG